MSTPGEHVGVDALLAERKELLDRYDAVKMKGGYDAVESQHGNAAEDYFRAFLAEFLPKKYGVTKGHVITPGLGYAGAIAPVPRISTKSGPFSPGEWLESLPGSARGY